MRFSDQILLSLIFVTFVYADERVMDGGKSPDGAYEIRVVSEKLEYDPNGYGIHLHSVMPEKRLFTIPETGGYLQFPAAIERDHAYWHGSSRFVALTDQGSRHSRELYVVAVFDGTPKVLEQPDFFQNALGRVNAVEIDFASVVNPKKWDGDDLILEVYCTANHRISYTFEVILHLNHDPQSKPSLSLKSVKKLKEEGG